MKIVSNNTTLQLKSNSNYPLVNAELKNKDSIFAHAVYPFIGNYIGTSPVNWINDSKIYAEIRKGPENKHFLYCKTVFEGIQTKFIVDFPAKDKKLAHFWTIDDWNSILQLCSSRISLMNSLENVKESMRHMKRFSDIHKLSSIKRNEMKIELRKVNANLRDAINSANRKASEYQVFNA